ncbi:hypothetical protein LOTGIDRAFT_175484 [Lottia gigantea]|uniref:Uncharacterized protein n=1 Tax=Lottia gigantea TaxID=225164 RepID=V4AC21_LOTGI|nr:hypothetical protein LOTGIDRAFT_175484 [Lottia gigantea]ESO94357.1 hypothetical protein LOTGIDRAFT_175484 [Lottia gigantea]
MAEIPINSSEKNVTIDGEFDLSSILFDKKLSSTSKSINEGQEKRKRTANKAIKELNHTQTSTSCPDPNSKMDSSTSTSIDDTTVMLAETNSKLDSNLKPKVFFRLPQKTSESEGEGEVYPNIPEKEIVNDTPILNFNEFPKEKQAAISIKLLELEKKNIIERTYHEEGEFISNIFTREKKDGGAKINPRFKRIK